MRLMVDSGALLALIDRRDQHHTAAAQFFREQRAASYVVPQTIFAETPKGAARRETGPAPKPLGGLALAAGWPVHEVLLSRGWEEHGATITLLLARRSPTSGKVASALLLIDLGCLGAHALRLRPMMPVSLNLAAKIVFTGLEYADRLGFKPDPVYAQAAHLLSGANPDAEPTAVPTGGPEGKPFYVNGPHDHARKIVEQLVRAVEPGNFHYVTQGSKEEPGLGDDSDERSDDATRRLGA